MRKEATLHGLIIFKIYYKMDKPSQSTGPEDTPKRSRWDMTPVASRDTNSAIRAS